MKAHFGDQLRTFSRSCLAQRLSISERTLDRLLRRGEGPAFTRVGGRILFLSDTVEAWLRAREALSRTEAIQNMLALPEPLQSMLEATGYRIEPRSDVSKS